MNKIIIKGLDFFAYHGVLPEEAEKGQNFTADLILYADLTAAQESDNLEDTVNYAAVCDTVIRALTMRENRCNLIERAAGLAAQAVLDGFPQVEKVEITLKKPEAPIDAAFDYVAVQIERER